MPSSKTWCASCSNKSRRSRFRAIESQTGKVLAVIDLAVSEIINLLQRYDLCLVISDDAAPIPGTYWGEPEAGIIGHTIYARSDTPIHSLLHETCHVICMPGQRRDSLCRDAGGDDLEESAVCYLQVLLADCLQNVGRKRLMRDMDAWGYSFRLGNTRQWFEQDAEDARQFLLKHNLITESGVPSFSLRA